MTSPFSPTACLLQPSEDGHDADIFQRATQNDFLRLAGQGKLSKERLSQWLAQDRLYAQAYIRFIGGLMERVHLPVNPDKPVTDTLEWRVVSMLQTALSGIMTEIQFFEKTARTHGLDLTASDSKTQDGEFGPNENTKKYINLFDSYTVKEKETAPGLFEGLVVLWATEKTYLEAWTYAKQQGSGDGSGTDDLDGGALRSQFIPNWTSEEFRAFVKDIGECLDAYAARFKKDIRKRVWEIWMQVMSLEVDFWPRVD